MSRVAVKRTIPWRGSITDLATDVADLLTKEEWQKLIAELERFQQLPHLAKKWAGSGHTEGECRSNTTGVCPLCKAPLLNYNEPCNCTRTGTRSRR